MAALDVLGGLALPAGQAGPDVPGPRGTAAHRLALGLGVWGGGGRVGGVPPPRGEDHIGGPAIAGEDRGRGGGEVATAGAAGVALAGPVIATIALGGASSAGRAGDHAPTLPAPGSAAG